MIYFGEKSGVLFVVCAALHEYYLTNDMSKTKYESTTD